MNYLEQQKEDVDDQMSFMSSWLDKLDDTSRANIEAAIKYGLGRMWAAGSHWAQNRPEWNNAKWGTSNATK